MEDRKSISMDAFMEDFANVYYIKLLLKEPVEIRNDKILKLLLQRFNNVDTVVEQNGMYSYALTDRSTMRAIS